VIIAENPDLKLTELARVMGVARSGAVALVDFLAERGYVARLDSPTDKRAFQLRITAAGRRALAAMTEAVRSHDARIVGMLTNAEQGKLMNLLRRMVGL
jgi:DNA-binding MarR family transcriptional regulator